MGQIIIKGKNNNYPTSETLPELSQIPYRAAPYPDNMMRCVGKAVNEGYPTVLSVENIETVTVSGLFFADKPVLAMFYNGQQVFSAFCKDKKVFGLKYLKK